ncbi:MAG: SDR family NAD(P)-dependent oxidoreductase [Rhodobiaceae bacterium]|nr:SDR family NAD(P)-dependent oxidoreductase [Rhodobiaceae bacterium]
MSHVVITGATSGIGRALAIRLAAPAVTLSLLGRNRERLDAVAADAMASGARVEVAQIDVRDAAALSDWLAVRDIAVPIDTAIACAGIGGGAVMASAERGEDAAMAVDVMAVNAGGVANIVAPLVSRFMARGRGKIVIIGSAAGEIGLPHSPAYSASKAAVRTYGDGLRRLLRPRGVTVTVALPGFVDTPMSRSLPGAQPFLWSAERAAARIVRDMERGASYSHPPLPLRLAIGIARLTPVALLDLVLTQAFRMQARPRRIPVEKPASVPRK